jgi:hypothetical protein
MRLIALTTVVLVSWSVVAQGKTPKAPSAQRVLEPLALVIADAVGVERRLATAIITQESRWNPMAISNKGAMGLMQLMPKTAAAYGVENPYDPVENMIAGLYHFRLLQQRYRDDRLALAAYNAGEGAVNKYSGIPPYKETVNYVRQILARKHVDSVTVPQKNDAAVSDVVVQTKTVSPYEAETALDLSGFSSSDIKLTSDDVAVEQASETLATPTIPASAPRR